MKDPRLETSKHNSVSSCECVEERIHDLMDLRKPLLSDELVREHIASCDECVELVVDLGALNDSLSQIPIETINRLAVLTAGPSTTNSVAAPGKGASPSRLHPLSFVTSVVCLLLVMLTSGLWLNRSEIPEAHRITISQNDVPVTVPASIADSRTPMVATSATPMQLGFVPHKTTPPGEILNAVSFEQLSDGVEPFQDYLYMTSDLPGIRPISNSFNATIHLLKSISNGPLSKDNESQPDDKDPVDDGPNVGSYGSSIFQLCSV